jgi:hypothetical protein
MGTVSMTAEIVSPRKNAGVEGRGLSPEQAAAAAMVAEAASGAWS